MMKLVENKSWLQPKKIGVHDFIMSLPDNYDFDVKNAGYALIWTTPVDRF
jgi:ABC-type bacteriocin/lantibiotic exporter with double-glycine peptidase domain